ncbi:MAG: APC family permease [Desulfurococcales archaeon]|nr:APC family permease [Desulfurococcales archaeon]
MSLADATALSVGIIIGSSIFSLVGVGAQIAGRDLPLSLALSSLIALFVAYNYAKLGSTYISNAGPIEYIIRGLGDRLYTGIAAMMLWFIYVSSLALFAKTLAGYTLALAGLPLSSLNMALIEALSISFFVALNFKGSKAVGRAEVFLVAVKLFILMLFIIAGFFTIKTAYLKPVTDQPHLKGVIYAATLFFLSYTGFGLITNASENIENPRRNVPLAIYLSLLIASLVYIGVSIVAVGNLPVPELVRSKEYALAEAAEPFLGRLGFSLISIGAIISVSSAMNSSIYGGANVAYSMAKKGEIPEFFERTAWKHEPEGLYMTALLGFILALSVNLEGVAAVISSSFIVIYIGVILSHLKLVDETNASKTIVELSLILVLMVLIVLLYSQYASNRSGFYVILLTYSVFTVVEYAYRKYRGRRFKARNTGGAAGI